MEAKRIDYNVQSTVRPDPIAMNDYEVKVRTNVETTEVPNGMDSEETTTMYVYTETVYDRNEYFSEIVKNNNLSKPTDRTTMSESELVAYLKNHFNECCDQALAEGITVEVPELGEKNFSCKLEDQFNIEAIIRGITADAEAVYYHSNGDKCRLYDIATFAEIAAKIFVQKYQQTSYCNLIKSYIEDCSQDKRLSINYGDVPNKNFSKELKLIVTQGVMGASAGFVTPNETFNNAIAGFIQQLLA